MASWLKLFEKRLCGRQVNRRKLQNVSMPTSPLIMESYPEDRRKGPSLLDLSKKPHILSFAVS
ncbi:unnamed protein product [Arabidopsis thaliana]|uniref:Uncharacterized protein n=1 Tax=Arabidopsis thaliana TaxID=3702 RepID=A0A5S9YAW6_ARATH|nr:unnamed protein product [Arabidopsis thaliana]